MPPNNTKGMKAMKINLGQIVASRMIYGDMEGSSLFAREVVRSLARYQNGDWGDCCEEDCQANDYAAEHGERILAAYETSRGKIWIITEWDRSATTILYPSDY